ncbi:MAG: DNA internalization-related competence protein ComEC/Rec2 [Lachnospiraceae bacterium]|nr:DNA internalization-related competence protein ComEC/Rec2 [Lachnospiraceae bacterium]
MKRPLLFFCILFLLAVRLALFFSGPPEDPYEDTGGGSLTVYGIVEKKERKNDEQVFYLRSVSIAHGDTLKVINKTGLICASEENAPPMGAYVRVTGSFRLYPEATNPGEFDMRKYYLCLGYGGKISVKSWSLAGQSYSPWREGLWNLRCRLGELYDRLLPEEDAAVLKAMVLGDKGDLSAELKDLYRANGISHILAISGLHISILGMGLYRLLRRASLPILPSALIALGLMVNYALMSGAGTSTVRAVIMFGLCAGADAERRSYDLPTALGLSAASTVLFDPYLLLTSAFWLSYSAVAGVAVFGPALWGELKGGRGLKHKLFRALGASLSVSVFTLPFVLINYYEVPLYSVLLNLLVIPLMSVLMVCGLIILPLGLLYLPLGIIAGLPCHWILAIYRVLCEFCGRLPGHSYIAGSPPAWKLLIVWLVFALLIAADRRRIKQLLKKLGKKGDGPAPRMLCFLKLLLCAFCVLLLFIRIRPGCRISMLDVGQGDGICIETKQGVLMIDGGSTTKDKLYQYQLGPFLKYSGISRIDYWFLSHPDKDHISGLQDLLADAGSGISVGCLVLPEAKGAEADFAELIALARDRGTGIVYFAAGDCLHFGKLRVDCLHPAAGYDCEDVNEYSQILLLNAEGIRAVFGGDATAESETAALRAMAEGGVADACDIDILKLGHHGSRTSNTQEWLDKLSPHTVLISCGLDNSYGHPHKEVLERVRALDCEVYRTDHDGCITMVLKDGRADISAFCR